MNNTILINVTGHNKPGLTTSLTTIVMNHCSTILDISQSVMHDAFYYGVLAYQQPHREQEFNFTLLLNDLKLHAQQHDLQLNYRTMNKNDYEHWIADHSSNHYTITLLAKHVIPEHIIKISNMASTHGLHIDQITRLSDRNRSVISDVTSHHVSCFEFSVRGGLLESKTLRCELLNLSTELEIDIAFQKDTIFRKNRRLIVFDMDSTLINQEVINLMAEEADVAGPVAKITERSMRGEIDFNQSLIERLSMLKGLHQSSLSKIAERITLTEGVETLIYTLRFLGYRTAIVSGGFTYFTQYLQQQLNMDYIHANELEIIDDKLTGRIKGEIIDGNRKAVLLKQLADKENISLDQVIAVGDGANDIPMLNTAGLGIAFKAKPIVKKNVPHSISSVSINNILYLLGFKEEDLSVIKDMLNIH